MLKNSYAVIDIFAGPGGLGEGFSAFKSKNKTKFENVLSIEKDRDAHKTLFLRSFYRSFHGKPPKAYFDYIEEKISLERLLNSYPENAKKAKEEAQCIELGKRTHDQVKELIKKRLKDRKKWVLVGGPPCQAYSLVGRSRMKSTNPDFEKDERHFLYQEYLKILSDHRPPIFVMENVKGMLSARHNGKSMVDRILGDLSQPSAALNAKSGGVRYNLYSLTSGTKNANHSPEDFLVKAEQYGIPQARHRVLILGIRSDIDIAPKVLSPKKAPNIEDVIGDLPKLRSGLSKEEDTIQAWKKNFVLVKESKWFKKTLTPSLKALITKTIKKTSTASLERGKSIQSYTSKPRSYSSWYRKGCGRLIANHESRSHMHSDIHRYLFAACFAQKNGRSPTLGDFPAHLLPSHKNIKNNDGAFADRFRVQCKGRPSTTITSHISKDGHYFIHYDPSQCRSLTVREAARLQTFPDSYKFEGNRTSQYHQVGNAVPPLLSCQIAEIVFDILERISL